MRRLALAFLLAGCNTTYSPAAPVPIADLDNAPAWVAEALAGAATVWRAHGVTVVSAQSGIALHVGMPEDNPPGTRGLYSYWNSTLYLDETLQSETLRAQCVLAHELGHSIGMVHADDDSKALMFPHSRISGDTCPWSNTDDEQLANLK